MKTTELKIELLYLLLAALPFLSLVLRYANEWEPASVEVTGVAAAGPVYVETMLKNEGDEGLVSVWIEQGGTQICRTVAFIARRELRRVVFPCPTLTQEPFSVKAQAQ